MFGFESILKSIKFHHQDERTQKALGGSGSTTDEVQECGVCWARAG